MSIGFRIAEIDGFTDEILEYITVAQGNLLSTDNSMILENTTVLLAVRRLTTF